MSSSASRGAISIFITLLMMLVVTSSAIILSGLLSQQIRISEDIISSERAFYASGSGVEEALYRLVQLNKTVSEGTININDGVIEYPESNATYEVSGALFISENTANSRPCVNSAGRYREEERRVNLQSPGDEC